MLPVHKQFQQMEYWSVTFRMVCFILKVSTQFHSMVIELISVKGLDRGDGFIGIGFMILSCSDFNRMVHPHPESSCCRLPVNVMARLYLHVSRKPLRDQTIHPYANAGFGCGEA